MKKNFHEPPAGGAGAAAAASIVYSSQGSAPDLEVEKIPSANSFIYFHQLFETIAAMPHLAKEKAVSLRETSMSYETLNHKANQFSHYLLSKGIGPGDVIVIALPRSIEAIIALLGVLKSGAAFSILSLPISHDLETQGRERFQYCLGLLRPKLVVTQHGFLERCGISLHEETVLINFSDLKFQEQLTDFSSENPTFAQNKLEPSRLMYITFTSGSTGNPKGVMIEHKGLNSRLFAHQELMHIKPGDKVAQFCRLDIDAAFMEVMLALGTGAELVLVPEHLQSDYLRLTGYYQEQEVSIAIFTPTVWQQLDPNAFPKLRALLTTGEGFKAESLKPWCSEKRLVVNGYGPCEASIATSLAVFNGEIVTIGKALKGLEMWVLDHETQQVLGAGQEGEVYLRGLGIGLGYFSPHWLDAGDRKKLQELTAERFIANIEGIGLGPWYRTGDKAYLNNHHEVIITGRYDRQFKVGGRIVAPENVEEKIRNLSGAEEGAVYVYLREEFGKKHIVAGLKLEHKLTEAELFELVVGVSTQLDNQLLPQRWCILETAGIAAATDWKNKFGQIIRDQPANALQLARKGILAENLTQLQLQLKQLWKNVLLTSREEELPQFDFSIDDHFHFIGGDSLAKTGMINLFSKMYPGISFPQAIFERNPTIRYLASYVQQCRQPLALYDFVPGFISSRTGKPSLYFVHPITGEVVANYQNLANEFKDRKSLGIAARAPDPDMTAVSIVEIADDYVRAILKESQGLEDSFVLIGHSAGGAIVYEMAIQLEDKGYKAIAILLDALAPNLIRSFKAEESKALVKRLAEIFLDTYRNDYVVNPLSEQDYGAIEYTTHDEYLTAVFTKLIERTDSSELKSKFKTALQFALAVWNYKPSKWPKEAYLWVAKNNGWHGLSPQLGWRKKGDDSQPLVPAVKEVYYVADCNHFEIVVDPRATSLIKAHVDGVAPAPETKKVPIKFLERLQASLPWWQHGLGKGGVSIFRPPPAGAAAGPDLLEDAPLRASQVFEALSGPPLTERIQLLIEKPELPAVHFSGRKALHLLEDIFESNASLIADGKLLLVAVSGWPGAGKTELVKDYGHNYQAIGKKIVLFFNADKDIASQYKTIANKRLGFPYDIDAQTAKQAIEEILENNPGFLLIFDHVNNFEDIKPYLPLASNARGRVLITTRTKEILPDSWGSILDISKGLQKEEAKALLLKTREGEDEAMAELLAARLGFLPLAVNQAAGYIQRRLSEGSAYSISMYLQQLNETPQEAWSMAAHPAGYDATYDAVISKILREINNASAIELAKLLSVLYYDQIPIGLLEEWAVKKALCSKQGAPEFIRLALARLKDLGLINLNESSVNMHLVVQEVIRVKLVDKKLLSVLVHPAVTLIEALSVFRHQADSIVAGALLVNHAEEIVRYLLEAKFLLKVELALNPLCASLVNLLHRLGNHYERNNLFVRANEKYQLALELCKEFEANIEPGLLAHSFHNLGSISFRTLENLDQAERYLRECLAIRERVYGYETYEEKGYNPTLHALHNIGYLLIHYSYLREYRENKPRLTAKLQEARVIFDDLLMDRDNPSGEPQKASKKIRNPFYLIAAYINSGHIARLLGDFKRAERDFGHAKRMLSTIPEKSHFEMAEAYNNFGFYYLESEYLDLEQAKYSFDYAKSVCEIFMAPNKQVSVSLHLSTAYEGLARTSLKGAKLIDALKYAKLSLRYRRNIYSADHIRVLDAKELEALILDSLNLELASKHDAALTRSAAP